MEYGEGNNVTTFHVFISIQKKKKTLPDKDTAKL